MEPHERQYRKEKGVVDTLVTAVTSYSDGFSVPPITGLQGKHSFVKLICGVCSAELLHVPLTKAPPVQIADRITCPVCRRVNIVSILGVI